MNKRFVTWSGSLLAVLLWACGGGYLCGSGSLGMYHEKPCVVAANGPVLLGEENDILWEDAAVLELTGFSGEYDPTLSTHAQVGCSEVGIGVVFWCSEPGIINNPAILERDQPPWDNDCFEIMISPGLEDPDKYYHIAVTPACALLPVDSRARERSQPYDSYGHDTSWDCEGMVVVTSPWGKKGWKGVVVIPFEAMGVDRRTLPRMWRLNLSRSVPGNDERAAVDYGWSVQDDIPPHDSSMFGYLAVPMGTDNLPDDIPESIKKLAGPDFIHFSSEDRDVGEE